MSNNLLKPFDYLCSPNYNLITVLVLLFCTQKVLIVTFKLPFISHMLVQSFVEEEQLYLLHH